jgi:hypothetical protein
MSRARIVSVFKKQASESAVSVTVAGGAIMGVGLYTAGHVNTLHNTAQTIASNMANVTTIEDVQPLVTQQEALAHDLFVTSEIQGLTAAALLYGVTLPSLWNSIKYSPEKTTTLLQHLCFNADYYVGRGLQLAAASMTAEGFVQHGKQNTAVETALFCAAPLVGYVGTFFINYNKLKNEQIKGISNQTINGQYNPLLQPGENNQQQQSSGALRMSNNGESTL